MNDDQSPTTENEDWAHRPEHLRQIAAELDGDRKTPCTQAAICREAADEIERLRAENAELRSTLRDAIEWDGHDSAGVPAVWLEAAHAALNGTNNVR